MNLYLAIIFAITILAGWATHLTVCVQDERVAFLIVGLVLAPVGVVHGWYIWFNAIF